MRLSDVKASNYDTVFYPGGHGPMWDLAEDSRSIALIEAFYSSGAPVAAVCHAPGALHRVNFEGRPLVQGKRVLRAVLQPLRAVVISFTRRAKTRVSMRP